LRNAIGKDKPRLDHGIKRAVDDLGRRSSAPDKSNGRRIFAYDFIDKFWLAPARHRAAAEAPLLPPRPAIFICPLSEADGFILTLKHLRSDGKLGIAARALRPAKMSR
jgi:hypothetical protein